MIEKTEGESKTGQRYMQLWAQRQRTRTNAT